MENQLQVELSGIVKDYKNFRAVDHIDLQIQKGEIVSLLGASGCGKTTTLRMIAGLISPTEGTVKIEGKDVTYDAPYHRDVSMVFQNYALFPHMTIYENIVYGLKNRKIKDKKILLAKAEEVLNVVQLVGQESKYPQQLSGGQQQRVSLARALIVQPKVMLFDEPLSNLDAKLRVQTRTEIRRLLKQMNVTALYVTHDQEEALTISDRIAIMNKGKIEQITYPDKIYNDPSTKFVADFIGHANIFDGDLVEEGGEIYLYTANHLKIACMKPKEIMGNINRSVVVRPENVLMTNMKTREENSFEGKIIEKSFLGNTVRYEIQLYTGEMMMALIHPDQQMADDTKPVFVSFHKEKAVVIGNENMQFI